MRAGAHTPTATRTGAAASFLLQPLAAPGSLDGAAAAALPSSFPSRARKQATTRLQTAGRPRWQSSASAAVCRSGEGVPRRSTTSYSTHLVTTPTGAVACHHWRLSELRPATAVYKLKVALSQLRETGTRWYGNWIDWDAARRHRPAEITGAAPKVRKVLAASSYPAGGVHPPYRSRCFTGQHPCGDKVGRISTLITRYDGAVGNSKKVCSHAGYIGAAVSRYSLNIIPSSQHIR